jgi:hypothetical protein
MQAVLLLVAPALFAASIYMLLGRIIVLVKGEHFAIIRVNWMTKIFVAGDVLSFLMQGAGEFSASFMIGLNANPPKAEGSWPEARLIQLKSVKTLS